MRALAIACTFVTLGLYSASAWSQVVAPVQVEVGFGGVEMRTETPHHGSRWDYRYVHLLDLPEGETRIEFNVERNGKKIPLPHHSEVLPADVSLRPDGMVQFHFQKPIHFEFFRSNEVTGQKIEVTKEFQTATASISEANRTGFEMLYHLFPSYGFVKKSDLELVKKIGEIFRTETPQDSSVFSKSELVPGFEVHGRPGLVQYLDQHPTEFPYVLYPVSIPLKVKVNPITEQLVVEENSVLGGPTFKSINAISGDMIGLGDSLISSGGPDGFSSMSDMVALDLQDSIAINYINARAEIIGMWESIEREHARLNGIPSLATYVDPATGHKMIAFINASERNNIYDGRNAIASCASLLTGLQDN